MCVPEFQYNIYIWKERMGMDTISFKGSAWSFCKGPLGQRTLKLLSITISVHDATMPTKDPNLVLAERPLASAWKWVSAERHQIRMVSWQQWLVCTRGFELRNWLPPSNRKGHIDYTIMQLPSDTVEIWHFLVKCSISLADWWRWKLPHAVQKCFCWSNCTICHQNSKPKKWC